MPHSFAYAGHCLPEVVTVPEQIRVFQCNFRGRFFQFGSTDSIPRDDMLSILIKKKKLYLLLKDFFCILSLWIQILCRLKPVLSYSLKWHDAGFQQLRIYPMAFRDSVGNCLSSTLIPPSSNTFSGLQENLIDSG